MKVTVKTPARLHLGLIDMNGDLGRMFGGLGVGIDHPNVIVEAQNAENFSVTGKKLNLQPVWQNVSSPAYQVQPKVHMNVVEAIPAHIGLGSGTQLSISHSSCPCKTV